MSMMTYREQLNWYRRFGRIPIEIINETETLLNTSDKLSIDIQKQFKYLACIESIEKS